VVHCPKCGYAANVEKASSTPTAPTVAGAPKERRVVPTPGMHTVAAVAAHLGVEPARVVKTLVYETDGGLVAAAIRGDRELNEVKLGNALDRQVYGLASEERVREATGAPVGFAGPVGLPAGVRLLADLTTRDLDGFVCGANARDAHLVDVSWGRDATPEAFVDLLLVAAGDPCPRCSTPLQGSRGIEVGHIFKLGTKYSEPMGCSFQDADGVEKPMIMGCYGFGIGRTVAAAIEQNHDADGVVWPVPLAPFPVLLLALNPQDEAVRETSERLYRELQGAGVEVLYDDRDERPGVKFKDADLIGAPVRLVVGAKALAEGAVELSGRKDRKRELVPVGEAVGSVGSLLGR
jgi:prolyl-tRNA synthetase